MKYVSRILCVLLCFMLVQVSFAEDLGDDYTQQEKFQRQLDLGSGLRGALKFAVTGESGLALLLAPLNDTEFQLRSILSGDELSAQFYAEKNATQTAQTEVYKDKDNWYIQTALLLGSTLSFPNHGDFLSSISSSETLGNPSFYSFIIHFLFADRDMWKDLGIQSSVLSWFENYGTTPKIITENNETHMKFQYLVPSMAVLSGMKETLHAALEDSDLQAKLKTLMTAEQANLMLNKDFIWYLDSVIDRIPLTGNAVFERTVTMQGTEISSHIVLPVYEPKQIMTQVEILTEEDKTTFILSGTDMDLIIEPESETAGNIRWERSTADSISVHYEFSSTFETSVDADDYHHDTTTYILKFTEGDTNEQRGEWLSFDPIEIQVRFHYYSKSAKRSATTLDITLAGLIPGGRIQAAAKFRTTTPWEITKMDLSDAISIESKSTEERTEIVQDIFANLLMSLSQLEPAEEEAAPEVSTPTDLNAEETVSSEPSDDLEAPEEASSEDKPDNSDILDIPLEDPSNEDAASDLQSVQSELLEGELSDPDETEEGE